MIFLASIKARLIAGWRTAHRFWSVRIGAIGAIFSTFLLAFPDQALAFWNSLPAGARDLLPDHAERGLSLFLFAAVIAARLFKQKGVPDGE